MRFVSLIAFGVWVGLAFLIYDIKHETRRLEARSAALTQAIQQERENLAVARAEWSHLTRPGHIEKLARDLLKFEAVRPEQIVHWKRRGKPAPGEPQPASPHDQANDAIAALIHRSLKQMPTEHRR